MKSHALCIRSFPYPVPTTWIYIYNIIIAGLSPLLSPRARHISHPHMNNTCNEIRLADWPFGSPLRYGPWASHTAFRHMANIISPLTTANKAVLIILSLDSNSYHYFTTQRTFNTNTLMYMLRSVVLSYRY